MDYLFSPTPTPNSTHFFWNRIFPGMFPWKFACVSFSKACVFIRYGSFFIFLGAQCTRCPQWFHCNCISMMPEEVDALEKFYCFYCPQYFWSCYFIVLKPHIHLCGSIFDLCFLFNILRILRITKHVPKFELFIV